MSEMSDPQRLDKWLWHARLFKSRSLAARNCANGKLRVNQSIIRKPSAPVRVGDVVTFAQGARIRVIRVNAFATRRGPAREAVTLYEDLAPALPDDGQAPRPTAAGARGGARPTKRDRRVMDQLRSAQ